QIHGITSPKSYYKIHGIANGEHRVVISYIGYKSLDTIIDFRQNIVLDVLLKPESTQLSEIVLKSESASEKERKSSSMGTETVNSSYMRKNMGGSLMQSLENIGGITTIAIGSGQSKPVIR